MAGCACFCSLYGSSTSREHYANPESWLTTLAGNISLSCSLGIALSLKKDFVLTTKLVLDFQTGQFVAGPRLRALDSPRTNCVTSLFTFYLRLGLLRRFWRRADRILKCNKCSLEYLQHFCHVLRFAPTLTFTLWFVHQTFEVVKSVPVISINKICKKILRIQIKALSCLGNPHLAF